MSSPGERTLPRACRDWLRQELAHWQARGLVSAEQRSAIQSLYRWEDDSAPSRTTATVTILGAVLLGLGAMLYVAANWPEIPRALRVALILAAMLTSHGLGWWLWKERASSPRVGHALVLLGNLFYGAGIWLIAQMYHLNAHWPTGFLAWAVGVGAVAWATGSRPNLALATALLVVRTGAEQGPYDHANPWFLPLLAGATALAYRIRAPETLLLGQLGLVTWLGANISRWSPHWSDLPLSLVAALGALGAGLLASGMAHEFGSAGREQESAAVRRSLAWPHLLGGGFLSLLAMLVATFLPTHLAPDLDPRSLAAVALLALGALAAAAWAIREARKTGGAGSQGRWLAAAPAGAGLLALLIPLLLLTLPAGTPMRLTFNLLLLGAVLGLLAYGYARRNEALVNLSLLFFVVQVVARYFDLFWQLLDRSLFFMAGGLLLLVGGYFLERSRRRWLQDWQGGERW